MVVTYQVPGINILVFATGDVCKRSSYTSPALARRAHLERERGQPGGVRHSAWPGVVVATVVEPKRPSIQYSRAYGPLYASVY